MNELAVRPSCPTTLRSEPLQRLAVSVIVPCFNELESLGKLSESLDRLARTLDADYEVEFLLIDDGSRDGTAEALERMFAARGAYRVLRHESNRGIAAAIMTGLMAAQSGVVCSIDADCTYDPDQLAQLLPLLTAGVDLVVASPYHPQGRVNNVPRWRLALSKAASGLYRLALRQKLHTYTSCFRVYRRAAVIDLELKNPGFVGITELVWLLDRRGSRIVECPAVLNVRSTGQSKMRVVRAGFSHLRLLGKALLDRVASRLAG